MLGSAGRFHLDYSFVREAALSRLYKRLSWHTLWMVSFLYHQHQHHYLHQYYQLDFSPLRLVYLFGLITTQSTNKNNS